LQASALGAARPRTPPLSSRAATRSCPHLHNPCQVQTVLSLLEPPDLAALCEEGAACRARLWGAGGKPRAAPALPAPRAGTGEAAPAGGAAAAAAAAALEEADDGGAGAPGEPLGGGRGGAAGGERRGAAPGEGWACGGGGGGGGASGWGGGLLEAAARAFLALMCDGRLVATDWLNEVRGARGGEQGGAGLAERALQPHTPTHPNSPALNPPRPTHTPSPNKPRASTSPAT
jgi:hypothetical protein